ncbi:MULTISPECIES: thiol peroxidase [Flavobacteriaceae]|jgi:thiol peroxidase|uniref:Thiol peroxidase n=1 Tax=Flagellimonas sp. MMG031 TaxID=3158549 RepID=A0AAU7MVH7_9FLAO|nr:MULTISPECIES: thiol peroxidase [unclassified Allomuricauda]MBO6533240.1 thiol peroxidase [Allomuricauda sp.]MBO6589179.1 thiol peroxidase [Allomuricauda sp.]MBO6618804.1 thiol peroxidase [Allomuricauda sp.]MBO6644717.1 thiol peroxidase [Allomuricauda sp.]MBO6746617.1 thiol peroxidase [Allomuricauda sp.]
MATVTLKGNELHTLGNLPGNGTQAPNFTLVKNDLSTVELSDYKGQKVVLNIFPSIDTGTCAQSVRQFNQEAAELSNTKVLCISKDLPFAQARFCGAEGIDKVETLSDFRDGNFGKSYQVEFTDGPLQGLLSRSVVVVNEAGEVVYTEQVAETVDEPNYKAALEALMDA